MEWSQSPAPAKGRPCRACPQLHASEVRLNGEGWLEDGCQSRPIGVTEMCLFHLECLVKLPISSLSQPSEGFHADPFPLSVTFGTSLASLPASRKCFMSQRQQRHRKVTQSHPSTSTMFPSLGFGGSDHKPYLYHPYMSAVLGCNTPYLPNLSFIVLRFSILPRKCMLAL